MHHRVSAFTTGRIINKGMDAVTNYDARRWAVASAEGRVIPAAAQVGDTHDAGKHGNVGI